VTSYLAVGLLLLLAPQADAHASPGAAVAPAIAPGPTFEDLWAAFVKADAAGDPRAAELARR
jgi:hypothetical protein